MLLTDTFTFVHMPKTGGTFVTAVLKALHAPLPSRRKLLWKIARRMGVRHGRYGELIDMEPKHGACHDIPQRQAGKPILSCVRGPYEWYVSQYEFAWWKRTFQYDPNGPSTPAGWAIERALPGFAASHTHFPNISFQEFMELCHAAADLYNERAGTDFGLYTHGFVRYFYRNPEDVLGKLTAPYIASGDHLTDRFPVTLLHTEHLKAELQSALKSLGYREDDLTFIGSLGKILPKGIGRSDDQRWQMYYTPEVEADVRARDDALFRMFPEYDDPAPHGGRASIL
jgi:hypothetical protein